MNALELLKQQHREVESIVDRIKDEDDSRAKKQLAGELAKTLRAHTTIETKIFYPASQKAFGRDSEEHRQLLEFNEEHELILVALDKLLGTQASDDKFLARLKVLDEVVQRHVEEEEQQLFMALESVMGVDELDRLGTQLERRFDSEMEKKATPRRGAAKVRRGRQPARTTRATRGGGGTTARKSTSRTGRRATSPTRKSGSSGRKSSGR